MLMSDGGSGSSPVTGQTYTIKTEPVTTIPVSGLTAQTIEAWFASIDASGVLAAGNAHTAASKTLNETAEGIIAHVQTMAQSWTGDAANAAVSNFKQLHAAAVSMAQVSHTVGQVLTQTAGVLQTFQNWKAPA